MWDGYSIRLLCVFSCVFSANVFFLPESIAYRTYRTAKSLIGMTKIPRLKFG